MAVTDQVVTEEYAIYCGDAMEVMPTLPNASIHLSVYSPPFGGLYHYSSNDRDLSNCDDYQGFFDQYEFFVRELQRMAKPGRITAVHCADLPSGNSGNDHLIDFSGDLIRLHQKCGWMYVARYCIWKEPLGVRNRTLAKGLAHRTIVDDSSRCSNAAADYLLVFRKKGVSDPPINHPTGFLSYAGERRMPADVLRFRGFKGDQKQNRFSHWIWRRYASAFWDDIRLNRVLPYRESKEEEDEKHVHPLQLDVIERCIQLWSNEGDTVLTPFMGVGSEVYGAITLGRRAIGVELKPSYYSQAKRNIEHALREDRNGDAQADLFSAVS